MLGKKKPRILAGFLSIFMLLQVLLMPISMAASTEDITNNGNLTIKIPRQGEDNKTSKQRELAYFKLSDKEFKKEELLEIAKKYDSLSMDEITKELGKGTLVKSNLNQDSSGSSYDIINLTGLEPGAYLFKETEESIKNHQYSINTFAQMTYEGDIDVNEIIPKLTERKPQSLRLHKIGYDKENDQKTIDLEGVKFNLLNKDGKVLNFTKTKEGIYNFTENEQGAIQELVTDANGRIEVNNLESGEYTFREIETLEGFEIREADTNINYDRFQENEVTVANYRPKEVKLHLHKTDGQTGDNLEGVGFRLYVKSGDTYTPVGINEDGSYVSDKNIDHVFKTNKDGNIILDKLPELAPANSYVFREVEPLDGYVSSDDVLYKAEKDKVLEVKNYKEKNELKLKKIDSKTKDPLDRVGFELYRKKVIDNDADKTVTTEDQRVGLIGDAGKYEFNESAAESEQVFQLYTDGNGEIVVEGLPEGEYYFKENEPLEDYNIRDNQGKESERLSRAKPTFTMENLPKNPKLVPPDSKNKKKGSQNFVKVDNSKTPKRLEGALFAVYSVDKKGEATPYEVDGKRLTIKSGSNGEFKVKDLPYGDYYLRETAAPEGYVLDTNPVKFTISEKSETAEAKFIVNKRNPNATPPGSNIPPKTPSSTPPTTISSVAPSSTPPSTRYYVPKNKPGIPRGPLVKTGDIRIIILVVLGLIMIIGGSHLVRKSEKTQRNLA